MWRLHIDSQLSSAAADPFCSSSIYPCTKSKLKIKDKKIEKVAIAKHWTLKATQRRDSRSKLWLQAATNSALPQLHAPLNWATSISSSSEGANSVMEQYRTVISSLAISGHLPVPH